MRFHSRPHTQSCPRSSDVKEEEDMTSTPKTRLLFLVNLFHQQLFMKCTVYQMLYWIQQRERCTKRQPPSSGSSHTDRQYEVTPAAINYFHLQSLVQGSASATDLCSFPTTASLPGLSPRLPGLMAITVICRRAGCEVHGLWSHATLAGVLTVTGSVCNPGQVTYPCGLIFLPAKYNPPRKL